MKKIFFLTCLAAITTATFAQRISNFTLEGLNNLGHSAAFNPTNNDENKPGDLQIVFPQNADLSNANAVIESGTATVETPMPTDWTQVQIIKLSQTDTTTTVTTNAWYQITCKKIIPTILPFALATTVESNFAEQWTGTTEGWAGACLSKSQKNCRFGNANANLIVAFTDEPDSLFFNINIAAEAAVAGTVFDVEESADGITWTKLFQFTEANFPGSQATKAEKAQACQLLSTTRYLRWWYSNRVSGNVSLTDELIVTKKDNTALHNATANQSVKLYPIPAVDVLNIASENEIAEIRICSLTGQTLQTIVNPPSQINISDCSTGTYQAFIKLNDGRVAVKTFLKK